MAISIFFVIMSFLFLFPNEALLLEYESCFIFIRFFLFNIDKNFNFSSDKKS